MAIPWGALFREETDLYFFTVIVFTKDAWFCPIQIHLWFMLQLKRENCDIFYCRPVRGWSNMPSKSLQSRWRHYPVPWLKTPE